MFPYFWPISIGAVAAYEGYKFLTKKTPSQFNVQPHRLYFAQALSAGPNPDPNTLIADLIGVGLTPSQGVLQDSKNKNLWSFLVQSGATPPNPVIPAIISSRLTIIKLDDRGQI